MEEAMSCVVRSHDGLRCPTVLEEFWEFASGKSALLIPHFMTSHTLKSHMQIEYLSFHC